MESFDYLWDSFEHYTVNFESFHQFVCGDIDDHPFLPLIHWTFLIVLRVLTGDFGGLNVPGSMSGLESSRPYIKTFFYS